MCCSRSSTTHTGMLWVAISYTTPKLITDYPTPFMFQNEVSGHGILNYKLFVKHHKSITTCSCCFLASVETICDFLTCHYHVPIERIIENQAKQANVISTTKTGVAVEFYLFNSKLYNVRSCCKHHNGMLFCSFLVKTRLGKQIIFCVVSFVSIVF